MPKKLFVGGLSWGTHDDSLRQAFEAYGAVSDAKVILDRDTGRSRGFGFVTFDEDSEADAAMQAMDGAQLDGRTIRVNEARERQPRGGGGGGYRGAAAVAGVATVAAAAVAGVATVAAAAVAVAATVAAAVAGVAVAADVAAAAATAAAAAAATAVAAAAATGSSPTGPGRPCASARGRRVLAIGDDGGPTWARSGPEVVEPPRRSCSGSVTSPPAHTSRRVGGR